MNKSSGHEKAPSAPTLEAHEAERKSSRKNVMTNNTTVVDMRKFVEARDGRAFTTSQQVAEAFGKQHHHVMQKLDGLECSGQFLTSNFSRVQFEHRGNTYEACEMTKDGFMFLVMGFTGVKAASIKEGYIRAFNEMAERLNLSSEVLVGDLVGAVIGSSGEVVLDRVIDQKVSSVPRSMQRSFRHTMKSRLRSRFNVQKTALIPAECLPDACNFVAAYAVDGEFLPALTAPGNGLTLPTPLSPTQRLLVSMGHDGQIQVREVPHDACVMTIPELLDQLNEPNGVYTSQAELFDFAIKTMQHLRRRVVA